MKRKTIGFQIHNSVDLDLAAQRGAGLCTALMAAYKKTEDPALLALHDQAMVLMGDVSSARNDARDRLLSYQSDPEFRLMCDGAVRWPDETAEGFEAVCTCNNACPVCDRVQTAPTPESALAWAAEGHRGRCQPCPRHDA